MGSNPTWGSSLFLLALFDESLNYLIMYIRRTLSKFGGDNQEPTHLLHRKGILSYSHITAHVIALLSKGSKGRHFWATCDHFHVFRGILLCVYM